MIGIFWAERHDDTRQHGGIKGLREMLVSKVLKEQRKGMRFRNADSFKALFSFMDRDSNVT
jgi:hypothetical protein